MQQGGGAYPQTGASAAIVSHAYGFTASSTEEDASHVEVYDRPGNFSTVPFTVALDATGLPLPDPSGF